MAAETTPDVVVVTALLLVVVAVAVVVVALLPTPSFLCECVCVRVVVYTGIHRVLFVCCVAAVVTFCCVWCWCYVGLPTTNTV